MSDAVIARTYAATVDTATVDGSYSSAATVFESGGQVQLADTKTSTIQVQSCGAPALDMTTFQALNLQITKTSGAISVHFDLTTTLDLDFKQGGVPTHFNAGVAISGDFTLQCTTTNYCDAAKYACGQLQTSCNNPSGSDGKIVVSCGGFDLSAVTTLFFSDAGSSGTGALILDHNQVTSFASFIATDGDSSADAQATLTGVFALAQAFASQSSSSDPLAGFTLTDLLMLKVLGFSAASMSEDPSTANAQLNTLIATYTGALLALDYTGRALAVIEAAPTDLALAAGSDGGAKGDGLTNDRTVTIDGRTGARDAVALYDGTKLVGTATADANGVFHVTSASLADGAHSLTVVATDANGVKVGSDPLTITVDGKGPATPEVTDVSTSGLSGTAEAGSTVAVYDNGKLVSTLTAGGDGHWSLARTISDTTTHAYTLVSGDAAGNTTASDGAAVISKGVTVYGTSGDDLIDLRGGQTVTGGYGHDLFAYDADSGKATIADFVHGVDKIQVDDALASSFSWLKAHAVQKGYDVVITMDPNHVLTLKSVALSTLTSSDFVFV